MNNRQTLFASTIALILGIAIGLTAGYSWGYQSGKSINTIKFGPDDFLQWRESKK